MKKIDRLKLELDKILKAKEFYKKLLIKKAYYNRNQEICYMSLIRVSDKRITLYQESIKNISQ